MTRFFISASGLGALKRLTPTVTPTQVIHDHRVRYSHPPSASLPAKALERALPDVEIERIPHLTSSWG